jgi:hypothetical protein
MRSNPVIALASRFEASIKRVGADGKCRLFEAASRQKPRDTLQMSVKVGMVRNERAIFRILATSEGSVGGEPAADQAVLVLSRLSHLLLCERLSQYNGRLHRDTPLHVTGDSVFRGKSRTREYWHGDYIDRPPGYINRSRADFVFPQSSSPEPVNLRPLTPCAPTSTN